MQPRIYYWIFACAAVVFVGCNAAGANEKEQSASEKQKGNYGGVDDLYLDDQDALEGSGQGGEVRDDLEASGSGLGPDDEDGEGDGPGYRKNNVGSGGVDKVDPVSKPVNPDPGYIEDPHKTKISTEDLAPKRPPDNEINVNGPPVSGGGGEYEGEEDEDTDNNHEVLIMNPKHEDRASSFFGQPGVLAAVIGGAIVGLLCAILVVMFIVYRMRKKDEGSYALDEPRRSPAAAAYPKPGAPHHNREFYA